MIRQALLALVLLSPPAHQAWGGWTTMHPAPGKTLRAVEPAGALLVVVGDGGTILTSRNATEWTARGTPTEANLYAAAFGQGMIVAVGEAGTILTSHDAEEWTLRETGVAATLRGVAHGKNGFIAVGDQGAAFMSPDGKTWSPAGSIGSGHPIHDILYADGRWVAVGRMTLASSPTGEVWQSQSIAETMLSITYGSGTFVAVGEGGREYRSPDGVNWEGFNQPESRAGHVEPLLVSVNMNIQGTVSRQPEFPILLADKAGVVRMRSLFRTSPFTILGQFPVPLNDVFSHAGRIVTVGDGGLIATIQWPSDVQPPALLPSEVNFHDLVVSGTDLFVVGRSGIIAQFQEENPAVARFQSGDRLSWRAVAVGDDMLVVAGPTGTMTFSLEEGFDHPHWTHQRGSFFRLVHESGTFWALGEKGKVVRSADGVSWAEVDFPSEANLRGMASGNGLRVIAGDQGTLATSPDNSEWTDRSLSPVWDFRDVAHGPAGFVAVGRNQQAALVAHSPNGVDWSPIHGVADRSLTTVAYGNGKYVATGGAGDRFFAAISEDGQNWNKVEIPFSTRLSRLIFDGERFVGAGSRGTVLASEDGVRWEAMAFETEPGLWSGVATGSGAVAIGESGTLKRRGPGGGWQSEPSGTSAWLWGAAEGDSSLVLVGSRGTILHSPNGGAWQRIPIDFRGTLHSVAFGGGRFAAVGTGEKAVIWSESGGVAETRDLPVPEGSRLLSIASGEGKFVAAGERGILLVSEDALEWESLAIAEGIDLHAVAFNPGIGFAVAGAGGFLAVSTDGLHWEIPTESTGAEDRFWSAAVAGSGLIALVRDDREFFGMADGQTVHPMGSLPMDSRGLVVGDWGAGVIRGGRRNLGIPPAAAAPAFLRRTDGGRTRRDLGDRRGSRGNGTVFVSIAS